MSVSSGMVSWRLSFKTIARFYFFFLTQSIPWAHCGGHKTARQRLTEHNKRLFLTWVGLGTPSESPVAHCPADLSEVRSAPGPGPLFPGRTESRQRWRGKTETSGSINTRKLGINVVKPGFSGYRYVAADSE